MKRKIKYFTQEDDSFGSFSCFKLSEIPTDKPMFLKSEYRHPMLGVIRITVNRRARRIIMRAEQDGIRITIPPLATRKDIEKALAEHGDKLKEIQTKKRRVIDSQYRVGDGNFCIEIQEYKGTKFMWIDNNSKHTLMCPENTDYGDKQAWLRKVITNTIHSQARKVLPPRLEALAIEHGFKYNECSVRNSHSRWGSCSGKGNINLSIYLVLLPEELIDYVLLHELCHTVEMNHGEHFWEILDSVCKGNSKRIRARLKKYSPDI